MSAAHHLLPIFPCPIFQEPPSSIFPELIRSIGLEYHLVKRSLALPILILIWATLFSHLRGTLFAVAWPPRLPVPGFDTQQEKYLALDLLVS